VEFGNRRAKDRESREAQVERKPKSSESRLLVEDNVEEGSDSGLFSSRRAENQTETPFSFDHNFKNTNFPMKLIWTQKNA
jgi:hypothetical protein